MGRRGRPRKNPQGPNTSASTPTTATTNGKTPKKVAKTSPEDVRKSTGMDPAITDNMADHVEVEHATPRRPAPGQGISVQLPQSLSQASAPHGLFTPQTIHSQTSNTVGFSQIQVENNPVNIDAQLWQTINKLSSQVADLANVQRLMLAEKQVRPAVPVITDSIQPSQRADTMTSILPVPGPSISIPELKEGNVDNLRPAELRSFCPIEGVPDASIRAALKGEFIYLEHFLLNLVVSPEGEGELCQFRGEDGNIMFKPRRSKRKIFNLQSWLEAWNNYERLMINYHRSFELYEHMSEYRSFICNCDRKYMWSAITAYDIRHRAQLSRKSVEFSVLNVSLQAQLLDASAIRNNVSRCLRCKSFDHQVNECPFSQTAPRTTAVAPQKKKPEICRNFNSLKCVTTDCPRRHVCRSCFGELPFDLCTKTGPCSNSSVAPRS